MAVTKGGQEMPRGKKFTAEQIIGKFRAAKVGLAQGKTLTEVVRKLGVTEQTSYRRERTGPNVHAVSAGFHGPASLGGRLEQRANRG